MNNVFVTSLIMLLLSFNCYSQIENIKIGEPYETIEAREKMYFYENNTITAVKVYYNNVTIQSFEKQTLKLIKQKRYEDIVKGFKFETILKMKDRVFLFYSLFDSEKKIEQLFSQEISLKKTEFIGTAKLLFDFSGKLEIFIDKSKQYSHLTFDKFKFQQSLDSSKIIVWYRFYPFTDESNKDEFIGLKVFDENLTSVLSKEILFPKSEKEVEYVDYSVDSDGNAYVLTISRQKGHLELVKVSPKTSKQQIITIVPETNMSNMKIVESRSKQMICFGHYGINSFNTKGFFCSKNKQ